MKEISVCNILVFGYVERQDQLLFSLLYKSVSDH